MKHTVEGSGHIKVDVKAPRGTEVKGQGGGMFKKVSVNRSFAHERSQEHANAPETQPR
jgi:hypothetical protein